MLSFDDAKGEEFFNGFSDGVVMQVEFFSHGSDAAFNDFRLCDEV